MEIDLIFGGEEVANMFQKNPRKTHEKQKIASKKPSYTNNNFKGCQQFCLP